MKTNFIKMSVAAAMLLTSGAYAGKIIGVTAGTPWDENVTNPPQQYGFGGWNLGNVNVRIVDAETGDPTGSTFDETDGTYGAMTYGDSFRSDISVDSEIRGILSGKDWPVGEPAGIKVVNDDTGTAKSGKSPNCIMTTSYLDEVDSGTGVSGYLDILEEGGTPVPTVCSSPFQTHKRFKVSMQPTTVDGITLGEYGRPFELTFNLDDDTDPTVRRYQVFQKINNYTNMRLNGYKIELLDENGTEVNITTAHDIKFSTIISTKQETDESGDQATFSHGLWGPYEEKDGVVKFEEGFFDVNRSGFVQAPLDESNTTLVGGPEQLNSNYDELFGLWLPYSWAPYGIFFDDDNDPLTDAELVAFWGTAPDAVDGTPPAWLKGQADNWAPVTSKELLAWMTDPLYSQGKIEDTVNLGLDYVVEVGLNSTIGSKFTIRITPRVAVDQTAPSYIDGNGDYIMPPTDYNSTEALLVIAPTPTFIPGEQNLSVGVADTTKNQDQNGIEKFDIVITTTSGDEENLTLTETDVNSSIFVGTIETDMNAVVQQDGTVSVINGTVVTATYGTLTATTTADDGTVAPAPAPTTVFSSGGGGGCTYNPDSKNFDMMFLVMMAMGLLYPFRRRFIK